MLFFRQFIVLFFTNTHECAYNKGGERDSQKLHGLTTYLHANFIRHHLTYYVTYSWSIHTPLASSKPIILPINIPAFAQSLTSSKTIHMKPFSHLQSTELGRWIWKQQILLSKYSTNNSHTMYLPECNKFRLQHTVEVSQGNDCWCILIWLVIFSVECWLLTWTLDWLGWILC